MPAIQYWAEVTIQRKCTCDTGPCEPPTTLRIGAPTLHGLIRAMTQLRGARCRRGMLRAYDTVGYAEIVGLIRKGRSPAWIAGTTGYSLRRVRGVARHLRRERELEPVTLQPENHLNPELMAE